MLYHKDVYLPAQLPCFVALLTYSKHARDKAYERGITLPDVLDTRKAELIELEVHGGRHVKGLWRMPYNDTHDLCLAVGLQGCVVRTAYLNERFDSHRTLDRSRYATR